MYTNHYVNIVIYLIILLRAARPCRLLAVYTSNYNILCTIDSDKMLSKNIIIRVRIDNYYISHSTKQHI